MPECPGCKRNFDLLPTVLAHCPECNWPGAPNPGATASTQSEKKKSGLGGGAIILIVAVSALFGIGFQQGNMVLVLVAAILAGCGSVAMAISKK